MDRKVRTYTKALIFRDGRMLAIKLRDQDGEFFIMPGGGQVTGELLTETVEREVAEETGLAVRAKDVAFVIEGAQGERDHRVDIVFLCDFLGRSDAARHPDHNQVGCEWLNIEALNRLPLYPSKLRRPIMNLFAGRQTPVYLGNENAGDPEVTD